MAKGSRSSVRKANNKKLKAKVFGPVENARAERLSAKLMELASQPKPPKEKMEVEQASDADVKDADPKAKETSSANEAAMEVDGVNQPRTSWIKAEKREKAEKHARIEKKQRRKARNTISFPKNRVSKNRS